MEMNPSSSSRSDRKTTEKNRRNQMKTLYSKLNSLVPPQNSRDRTSLPDQLGEAASYIKKLQINVERMKEKKDSLTGMGRLGSGSCRTGDGRNRIEVHVIDSALQVVLITDLDSQSTFNETIRLIHEEGAEIVNASFSVVDDIVYHTIHAKVDDYESGHHDHHKAARISERLKKFVHGNDHGAFC